MARYVAAHVKAAKAVDPYAGTDLPEYTPGQHCPVTLPSRGPDGGWNVTGTKLWTTGVHGHAKPISCMQDANRRECSPWLLEPRMSKGAPSYALVW